MTRLKYFLIHLEAAILIAVMAAALVQGAATCLGAVARLVGIQTE